MVLWIMALSLFRFTYRTITFYDRSFQTFRLQNSLKLCQSATPGIQLSLAELKILNVKF